MPDEEVFNRLHDEGKLREQNKKNLVEKNELDQKSKMPFWPKITRGNKSKIRARAEDRSVEPIN